MGKITAIKKLKRLYRVDLAELDQNKLYVCEDTIVHFFLSVDKIIEDDELLEIQRFDQFAQGKSLALYFLSFKMRTAYEVKKYLQEHEINSEQIEEILTVLSENHLVNDRVYAENFIRGKISMASAGPYQIKQKLGLKGIPNELSDEVISEIYTEEDQIDVAYKLAEKLVRSSGHRLTLHQLQQKIIQHLMNKGFNYSVSSIALESLELSSDEEHEAELLYDELEKVAKRYSRNYDGYERKQKIIASLLRKGYDYSDVERALRDFTFEDDN